LTQLEDLLSAEYRDLRLEARDLAGAAAPFAAEADESSDLHAGVHDALRKSGLAAVLVPSQHGGRAAEVDPVAVCVVREEIFPACSHLDSLFAMQGIGSYAITLAGSPEQRAEWLPRVAAAQALPAFAVTEPGAGTDLRSLQTTVQERGGRLRIRGSKAAISNAGVAAFYTVLGREGDGFSVVLVPAANPGLSVTRGPQLIAPHVIGSLELDVDLPAEARVGKPGEGLDLIFSTLAVFRVSVAAAAVGLARAALAEAAAHALARPYGKGSLAQVGAVADRLARSWTEIEMARLFTYEVAATARRAPLQSLHLSSLAKAASTEMAGRVVDRCVQVMGRFGLERGSRMERFYRAARPMRIYEGANEALWHSAAARLFPSES
jgi:acyl-CoA dehydrogenase